MIKLLTIINESNDKKDLIPGGLSDKLSLKDIAKKHNTTIH